MILLLLKFPDPAFKSTLPGIIVGALFGIAFVGLCGWGIAALLGRRFVVRFGLVLLAALVGLIGAVIGDAKTATKRPLNDREMKNAKLVFGESLDYSKISLRLNTRLMCWPKRRMNRTPFQTIYLSKRFSRYAESRFKVPYYEDLLIHELTHVWQTQHGIPFRIKLRTALKVVWDRKKPYYYGGREELGRRDSLKQDFRSFSTEQQGMILEHYFCCCEHRDRKYKQGECADFEHFARQVRYNDGYHIQKDTFP
jgi:hypothetical protein